MKRSEAKLSLTQTVIEGGQLSGGVATESNMQLADILKFGLDKLMNIDETEKYDMHVADMCVCYYGL